MPFRRRRNEPSFTACRRTARHLDGRKTLHITFRPSVAHYVALTGELDAQRLARAVVTGLQQADTLRMRFTEDNGDVWQWVDDAFTFAEPQICDLRTAANPHDAALALMQADLQQNLRVDGGKPLVHHQLIQLVTTSGTGISAIIIYWSMVSVSRQLPAR